MVIERGAPRRAAARPSAGRPRSTPRSRCTRPGSWTATTSSSSAPTSTAIAGGRGPVAVQGHRRRDRRESPPARALCRTLAECLRHRRGARLSRWSCGPRSPWAGPGPGMAYDETDLRRMVGAGLQASPTARGAGRGVDHRLEGVRARAHARPQGQRRGRLLHREPRPDGRAHRRLHHRRAGDDAHRPRIPAHARPRHRGHPRGGRGHRRLQHPVRRRARRPGASSSSR